MLGRRRLAITATVALLLGLLVSTTYKTQTIVVVGRVLIIGFVCMLAFGLFEQWPKRLPGWIARWVLQVWSVAIAMPFAGLIAYLLLDNGEVGPLWNDMDRMGGMAKLIFIGLLLGPWIAMTALLRQRDSTVRNQAQAFELQRSELERNALDARMRLLQAQVEPHFLFNTLANVRELVDAGSAQASSVLDSLIDYLRAAVPRLHDPSTSLEQELQLVRAYLEVMRMRMPDRLEFALHVDAEAASLQCPPMSVLTLVENAVRHGIDPAENGGRIDVFARIDGDQCRVEVRDTGVGLGSKSSGLGTGLATLRERLQLVFGGEANLHVVALEPHGVCARLDFPAIPITP
ncbi:MAG: histidine kinase [Dokdonella sp.]